jgi:hypothetical protein
VADMTTTEELGEVNDALAAIKAELATVSANMATKGCTGRSQDRHPSDHERDRLGEGQHRDKGRAAEAKAELIKWVVGLVLAQLVGMFSLIRPLA